MYKTILLFQFTPEKTAALHKLCAALSSRFTIRIKSVQKEDYEESLGFLAGIMGFSSNHKSYSGPSLPSEMLVFSGFTGDDLDDFLDAYHEKGLEKILLKAVLTPDNIKWTPGRLYRELADHIK